EKGRRGEGEKGRQSASLLLDSHSPCLPSSAREGGIMEGDSRLMEQTGARDTHSPSGKAIVVSTLYTDAEMVDRIGREAYSYRFVYRAFAPLLERWGRTIEVTQAESRLDYALWRAREQNLEPLHLSFLPLHLTYLTQRAPNLAFPFWEFPDIPNT